MTMRNGICPQCAGRDVRYVAATGHRSFMMLGMFRNARVSDYVCTACGYVESYVAGAHDLAEIRRSQPQVPIHDDAAQ